MQRHLSIILVSISLGLVVPACGKKASDTSGAGSAKPPEPVGSAGSGSAVAVGSATGSAGSGSGSAIKPDAPGEKTLGRSIQLAVVELTAKATPDHRVWAIRGAKDLFSLEVGGGTTEKETPILSEFPLEAPNDRNMNSTTVLFHNTGSEALVTVASFDEISKTGITPEQLKVAFDKARGYAIEASKLKLDKETEQTIDGAPGRILTFAGEAGGKKATGKAWMVYLAKPNSYVVFQVTAPVGAPLLTQADDMMKTLTFQK